MGQSVARPLNTGERLAFYELPLFVLSLFAIGGLLLPGYSKHIAGWPLVLGLVFVAMPHGAVDLQVLRRLYPAAGIRGVARPFALYVSAIAALAALFCLAAETALLLFGVASAIHFGMADVRDVEKRGGLRLERRTRLAAATARGGLLMALPFLFSTAASLEVVARVLEIAGNGPIDWDPNRVRGLALAVGLFAILTLGFLWAGLLARGASRTVGIDILELGVLAFTFRLLHPLFAMGLYVLLWHSWRHVHTLARYFGSGPGDRRVDGIPRTLLRLHVFSLPLLLPTLAMFGLLAWLRLDDWSSESLAALSIALFVVVTPPHHLLVERLHRSVPDAAGGEVAAACGKQDSRLAFSET